MFTSVALLGFGKLYAQDSTPKVDSVASFKGKYTSDSLKTGVWKYYYPNGQLSAKGKHLPNLIEYYNNEYDSSETIILHTDTAMAEQKVGLWKYFNDLGEKTFVFRLNNDNQTEFIKRYQNGVLIGKHKYKNGQLISTVSFYPNGKLKSRTHYFGNQGCKWERWDENGKKKKGRCAENVNSN